MGVRTCAERNFRRKKTLTEWRYDDHLSSRDQDERVQIEFCGGRRPEEASQKLHAERLIAIATTQPEAILPVDKNRGLDLPNILGSVYLTPSNITSNSLLCLAITLPAPLIYFFTARCTIVQNAVLRSHVVRLSVTLVDCVHIGWKSWKLSARIISPTPSLFV